MPRLFITAREQQLINDWTKELMKDVIDQKVYYYAVSTKKTQVHDVYGSALEKQFEAPVMLTVMAEQPEWNVKQGLFGSDQVSKVNVFVQARDLLDKNLNLAEGDFFTYGDAVFEVVKYLPMDNIFGQEEYESAYILTGILARSSKFDPKFFARPQKDKAGDFAQTPVQSDFVQQRGLAENVNGATGDIRQVRERLKEDALPIALNEGPAQVDTTNDQDQASSFNSDPLPNAFDAYSRYLS